MFHLYSILKLEFRVVGIDEPGPSRELGISGVLLANGGDGENGGAPSGGETVGMRAPTARAGGDARSRTRAGTSLRFLLRSRRRLIYLYDNPNHTACTSLSPRLGRGFLEASSHD